jgi:hypothetical protein
MWAGTFFEISAGSTSMWMNLACDVDELGPRGELRELAGDAIVEARADRADQVGLVHRVVGRARAVHAEHPEPALVRRPLRGAGRECAEAHQRARHREAVAARELA